MLLALGVLRRPRKIQKGKGVASSAEMPPPALPRRRIGIFINEPSANALAKVAKAADPKDKGKKSTDGRAPFSTLESSKFDPILVLKNSLSLEATS